MFKISDFSRLTRVSAKMLRHYDSIGLLKPAYVDPLTGYRYYSAQQLPRLNRIIALKDLGFSLEQIRDLLNDELPLSELRGILRSRQVEIEHQIKESQQRLRQVAARLRHIEQEKQSPVYEVVQRQIEPQLIATIRQVVPTMGQPITALFDELEAYVIQHNARAFKSPLMLFHDPDYREVDMEIEVAVPLAKAIPETESIQVYEVPGAKQMACVVYTGDYDRTAEVLNALLVWIDAHHFSVAGPLREVYVRFGADDALNLPEAFLADHHHAFVTEIQLPIQHKENEQ